MYLELFLAFLPLLNFLNIHIIKNSLIKINENIIKIRENIKAVNDNITYLFHSSENISKQLKKLLKHNDCIKEK